MLCVIDIWLLAFKQFGMKSRFTFICTLSPRCRELCEQGMGMGMGGGRDLGRNDGFLGEGDGAVDDISLRSNYSPLIIHAHMAKPHRRRRRP